MEILRSSSQVQKCFLYSIDSIVVICINDWYNLPIKMISKYLILINAVFIILKVLMAKLKLLYKESCLVFLP